MQYLESPIDPQSRQEERSIPPSTGYNIFGVAIFPPVLSDFGFAFERALSNNTFYYNYAPGHQYDNKPFLTTRPSHEILLSPKKLVTRDQPVPGYFLSGGGAWRAAEIIPWVRGWSQLPLSYTLEPECLHKIQMHTPSCSTDFSDLYEL